MAVAGSSYGDSSTVVTHAYEFLSETLTFNPNWLDGQGLKAGQAYQRSSRTVQSRFEAAGDIVMEHTIGSAANAVADSMGFWWKYALGSTVTTPTLVLGTAYKQVHTPGSKAGQYITCQVGRPQILSVTVQPFTYIGAKVTDWEFSCNDNQIAQLKVTVDAQNELTATALAAASYPTPNGLFAFSDASAMTLGGTVSTSGGETSISGGTSIASRVNGITITGSTPMKIDRFGLGSAGLKGEPIENAIPTITGTLSTEFYSRAELYDVFKSAGTTALEIDFTKFDASGNDANGVASGPNPYRLSVILPAVKFKTSAVNVGGPDVVPLQVGFQAYDNGTGSDPVIQVKLVSKESSAI
jgi:hypothetical protein